MRYEDGCVVPCKDASWEIYDSRDNKDYICRGNCENYGHFCDFDEKCKGYIPKTQKRENNGK